MYLGCVLQEAPGGAHPVVIYLNPEFRLEIPDMGTVSLAQMVWSVNACKSSIDHLVIVWAFSQPLCMYTLLSKFKEC